MLELAGPLGVAVEPGQVLRLLQDHHVGGGGGQAVHGVAHREDAQQQAVVPPRVERYLQVGVYACCLNHNVAVSVSRRFLSNAATLCHQQHVRRIKP